MNDAGEYHGIRQPLVSILLTLLTVLVGFQMVGPLIGWILSLPLYPGTIVQFTKDMQDPFAHPELRYPIMVMQACGTLFGMIVVPFVLFKMQKRNISEIFRTHWYAQPVLIVVVLVIVFMGVNSIFIEWNQNLRFPGDEWARSIEEKLAEGVKFITNFKSPTDLLVVFILIAVLPAIGEELVFRGMIQNDFYRATRNIHLSIWISAILFSAIHVQFFGFVPRMLLGALFGYLYYWSGSLWMAILAHFVNNGFTVIGLYLYQRKMIDIDVENATSVPWQAVLFSAVFSILLLYSYKNFFDKKPKPEIPV